MGVVRINAIGPGAVGYLLHGCDSVHPEPAAYFTEAVKHGEPAGVWLGSGMEAMGLSMRAGDTADETSLRAIFGELRYPTSERATSTEQYPVYLGTAPRTYSTLAERVAAALKAEPDATRERQREIEVTAAQHARSNTAYYDVTFSPAKSVSVYYAALVAAGDVDAARAVREAHDRAVRIAVDSAEVDVAWARTGRHGRASPSGRTVGEWQQAAGWSGVAFTHHTNRDGEPQLHVHVAVLNRVALADGRIFALDGKAFGPVKDAMATAYDRAFEALLAEATGVVFATRVDGKGREIAGVDPMLIEEASTRTRESVQPRIEELVVAFVERHGHEPGPKARHAIADQAVKDTRRPKSGPAGPAAVAAWVERINGRRARLEVALDAVDEAMARAVAEGRVGPILVEEPALAAPGRARGELGAQATDAGLAEVQRRYATWTVGNLVAAIDRHLGDDAGAVGLGIADRQAWVRGLAEAALDPGSGSGAVRVSAGDPVPVPVELRREVDGRSRFRPHIDERYTTAEHLAVEQRLVARATAGGALSLTATTVARVAEAARRAGLSADQVAAVARALASERRVEVLVGPAGAGKSHTLGFLSQAWGAEHGGRVIGTATAEIATRNLAGLGMEAANTHRLLAALTPDGEGRVRDRLTNRDLLVVDEAGMAATADLDTLVAIAAAAGAKVVWAGDHHQLTSVEAGGMFAHLAAMPAALELEQVHRFREPWERDASLRLRDGDPTVAAVYADEGRLRTGSLEQMEYHAARDYVADLVAGRSSLLIVGTNTRAAELSKDIHDHLVELGLVDAQVLTRLGDETQISAGDLIQTRRNDRGIQVDGPLDEHGRRHAALPVTNRELYTVIGYDAEARELLARDERGGVAHLPKRYVQEHVTLAYAVTNHAAQGVTVDRGRMIADRDTTREALYPALTRGRRLNVAYLVTDVEPDPHAPQRVRDTAEARFVQILDRTGADEAAVNVRAAAAIDERSIHTLGEYYDRVAAERSHGRHAALVAEHVGLEVHRDPAFGTLLGRLRAVELGGHDVDSVLTEALQERSMTGARSTAQVLHWRVGNVVEHRNPEYTADEVADRRPWAPRPAWAELAARHRAWARETGNPVETFLAGLAERAHERTRELGAAVAAAPPAWALEWLGHSPDVQTDPAGYRSWVGQAGEVAAYRELRGIPDEQVSIGAAPPPAQQLAHQLWNRAVQVGDGDPRAVDWRRAGEDELRGAVAAWDRERQWAPPDVSIERGEALALAHDARSDAALGRARLSALGLHGPGRDQLAARVDADEVMAEHAAGFAASLDEGHAARAVWWAHTARQREAAAGAQAELAHRRVEMGSGGHEEPDGKAHAQELRRALRRSQGAQARRAAAQERANHNQPEPEQRGRRDAIAEIDQEALPYEELAARRASGSEQSNSRGGHRDLTQGRPFQQEDGLGID